jgi:KaiC/GvpD/RAD55 family RecA-like ATPase
MDLDKALVSSLVRDGKGAVMLALENGIKLDYLGGDGQVALDFVYSYWKQHSDVPTVAMVLGKTGVDLEVVDGTSAFFIDEVLNRHLQRKLQGGVEEAVEFMKARDPKAALDALETLVRASRREIVGVSKVEGVGPLAQQVKALYERVKAGERGILTPWPTVNEETFGFWPQDLVIFVGRLGKGKSWLAISVTEHAWRNGHKVLFATTEMSKIKIVQRFCAYWMKLPYDDLRKGRLGVFAEKKFYQGVEELLQAEGLDFVGGDFDFSLGSFESAVEESDAELTVLDGAYLLKVEGNTRTEKAANAFNELKRMAHRRKIPFFVTSQLNREAKGNMTQKISVDQIALTDVAGWNGDVIYGVVQTEDMKKDSKMGLKPLKLREGMGIEELELNWNFDMMDFSEIPKDASDAADNDFDTGMGDIDGDPAIPF